MVESLANSLPLHTISEIADGKGAKAFQTPSASRTLPDRCMSLSTRTGIELDVEAATKEECEAWISTVYRILTSKQQVTHIHACIHPHIRHIATNYVYGHCCRPRHQVV